MVCALPNVISILPGNGADSASLDADLRNEFNLLLAKKLTQYLAGFRYYYIPTAMLLLPTQLNIYDIQQQLSKNPGFKQRVAQANFDVLPLISPAQASFQPTDHYYNGQWNLNKIQAQAGWESGTSPILGETVVAAVIDATGVDYDNPDFDPKNLTFVQGATFAGGNPPDINETPINGMTPGGESDTGFHGTACAGIIAARYNTIGIAGLAGRCQLMSLRVMGYQSIFVAAAINYASGEGAITSGGTRTPATPANVISMSFVGGAPAMPPDYLNTSEIKTALSRAFNLHHVVLCGSIGNSGASPPVYYPAADEHVIACGASDSSDDRCHPSWGSAYGGQLSVVAPGINIRTTDLRGTSGQSSDDYYLTFWGTSAAAPHVVGLAALLMAKYAPLKDNPDSVRAIIERTAEKVGHVTLSTPSVSLTYSDTPDKPHGDWNQETGYGRINVGRALTFADTMIRKHSTDLGLEPFALPPGDGFSQSDIVLSTIDNVTLINFDTSKKLLTLPSVPHYLYVRVTNLGPEAATGVTVSVRITKIRMMPFTGTDWDSVDASHLTPQGPLGAPNFSLNSVGDQGLAKFLIPATDVDTISSWNLNGQVPCVLAKVESDNDYAYAETNDWTSGNLLLRKNNLAQADLSFQPSGDLTPPSPPQNLTVH